MGTQSTWGSSVGLIAIYLILIIVLNGVRFVLQSFKSDFILDINHLVYLILGETLWMYALFLRSLHRGDNVFILSECFNGESNSGALKYFFDGLEIQRRSVIWSVFGIPVTLELYERIIGSLVSLLITALALV